MTRDRVCGSRSPRVWGATLAGLRVVDLVRDGVVLAYDDAGSGYPPLVFAHGAACNRRCWYQQVPRFSSAHRVVAVDLRGHGESDAPSERYTVGLFAEDLASTCTQLGIESPVVIGHSLGGLVALDFASAYPDQVAAAVLIDSPLLPGGDRDEVVRALVAGLRAPDPDLALRAYFASLFGPYDDAATRSWILDQAVLTEPHVTSSIWEESLSASTTKRPCASAGWLFSTSTPALRTPTWRAP